MTVTFDRVGTLVAHGADYRGRTDAIEFRARAGQAEIDRLAEVVLTLDSWGGVEWVAQLLEMDAERADGWTLCAKAMPLEKAVGLYVGPGKPTKVVFSEYVRLEPGWAYRLWCPGAVITQPAITVVGIQRPGEPVRLRARRRSA